jgi:hypothetical protein
VEASAIESAGSHPVVFGVYRDGDNNLDAVQERNVTDFVNVTARNPNLKVVAEDTTSVARRAFSAGDLRTESSVIVDGKQHVVRVTLPVDMSDRRTLAAFVSSTLEARARDPRFANADVWFDLVDHGGGDGGGLQSDSTQGCMSMEDIAGAIVDGRAAFRRAQPRGDDRITGVVANQCLMATLAFADALSRAGVKYLMASPETMIAPGVPSAIIADDLTQSRSGWPAQAVSDTMRARYGISGDLYHPAAAFDVLDLSPSKINGVRHAVRAFNDAVASLRQAENGADLLHDVRADVRSVRGMVRFDHSGDMPWHADRPAEAVYDAVAADDRLPAGLRALAGHAADAVRSMVLAHAEAQDFGPFHSSYRDAAGPTEHFPVSKTAYDPWAGAGTQETHNAFYDAVNGREFARAIGAYDAREDRAGDVA